MHASDGVEPIDTVQIEVGRNSNNRILNKRKQRQ